MIIWILKNHHLPQPTPEPNQPAKSMLYFCGYSGMCNHPSAHARLWSSYLGISHAVKFRQVLLGVNRLISVYRWTHPEVHQGSFSCQGLLLRKNLRYENQASLSLAGNQEIKIWLSKVFPWWVHCGDWKKGGSLRISLHIKPRIMH